MTQAIVRLWRWFSIGFIVAFIAYLFIRWDPDKVFTGVGVAVAVGVVLAVIVEYARARMRSDTTSQS